MRLINAKTMELTEFLDCGQAPPYAILSHTWEAEEVTFQEFLDPKTARLKKGYAKIERTCAMALEKGLDYAWVDTCCIDKTSSAELTEAINSMFEWYAKSQICYAWLADLLPDDPVESWSKCRWFTRGWTLQELIAPETVELYDRDWVRRGTKEELSEELSKVTGIDLDILRTGTVGRLATIPVARRMSWAANRVTTRQEDIAYCLLGIFDVGMPLLYGEGPRAFIRLQEEIVKESNDLTLFAWVKAPEDGPKQAFHGVLATSPADFRDAANIFPLDDLRFNSEFTMTNKGLRIQPSLASEGNRSVLPLNCYYKDRDRQIAIYLEQQGAGLYVRASPDTLALGAEWAPTSKLNSEPWRGIFISKRIHASASDSVRSAQHHALRLGDGFFEGWRPTLMRPENLYDTQRRMFLTNGLASFVGFAVMASSATRARPSMQFMVVFGVQNSQPWIRVGPPSVYSIVRTVPNLGEHARTTLSTEADIKGLKISGTIQEREVDGETLFWMDLVCQ